LRDQISNDQYNIHREYKTSEIIFDNGLLFAFSVDIRERWGLYLRYLHAIPDFRKSLLGIGLVYDIKKGQE